MLCTQNRPVEPKHLVSSISTSLADGDTIIGTISQYGPHPITAYIGRLSGTEHSTAIAIKTGAHSIVLNARTFFAQNYSLMSARFFRHHLPT